MLDWNVLEEVSRLLLRPIIAKQFVVRCDDNSVYQIFACTDQYGCLVSTAVLTC